MFRFTILSAVATFTLFASAKDITHDILIKGPIGKAFEAAEKTFLDQGYVLSQIKTVVDGKSEFGRDVPMAVVTYCLSNVCNVHTNVEIRVRVNVMEVAPAPGGQFENVYGEPRAILIGKPELF